MELPVSVFQEHYIPIIPDGQPSLTMTHSWKTMSIHNSSEPDHPCGSARRIGYTGNQADALAIYQLRILFHSRNMLLPGLFVFQEGFFVRYRDEQK